MAEVVSVEPVTAADLNLIERPVGEGTATNAPIPTVEHFDASRGIFVEAPGFLNERELNFHLEDEVDQRSRDGAVGVYHLNDFFDGLHEIGLQQSKQTREQAGSIVTGLGNFFGGLPNVGRSLLVEQEERFQEEAKKEFSSIDLFTALNPSRIKGAGARRRIFNELFRGGRRDDKRIKQSEIVVGATKRAMRDNELWLREIGLGRPEDPSKQFFFDVGSGVGSIGLAVGMTVATRNPGYAAVAFGTIQKSQVYQEARESEFDPDDAATISSLAGIVEGSLEAFGGGIFLRLAGVDKPFRRIVFRALEESGQEAAQQTGEEIITQGTGVRDLDVSAGIGRVVYSAAIGFVVGAPVASVVQTIESTAADENIPLTPQETQNIVSSLQTVGDELRTEAGNIMDSLRSNISFDEKPRKEAAEIIRKFVSGEQIDLETEFNNLSPTARRVLDSLVAEKAERLGASGRERAGIARTLETDIAALDQEIDSVSAAIEAREARGEGAKFLSERLDRLTKKRIRLEERLDEAALEVDGTASGAEQKTTEKDVARASIRGLRLGFRKGLKAAKDNIKEAQTALVDLIEKSGLSLNDRAKFIRAVKNIQTFDQLQRRLPGIQSRVIKLLNQDRSRTVKSKITKLLRGTKVRKQGGKPVGKFTPEVQEIFDTLRPIVFGSGKPTQEAAQERLEKNLSKPETTVSEALENRLLAMVAGDESVTPEMLEETLGELEALASDARTAGKQRLLNRRRKAIKTLETATEAVVAGGEKLERIDTDSLSRRATATLKQGRALFGGLWESWNDTIDILFNKRGVNASALIKDLGISRELSEEKKTRLRWNQKLLDAGLRAFGFVKERHLIQKLSRDSSRVLLGEFVDANGTTVRLSYSVAEARKIWMENQDSTINEAITAETGNAFTQDMKDAVFGLLSNEDIAFARAQLEIYQEIYDEINSVYAKVYGVNLPRNENYSPIQRDRTKRPAEEAINGDTSTTEFLQEQQFRRSVAPGGVKSRVANVLPLLQRSDVSAMHQHFFDMAHFVALAEKMTLINTVFGNARLRREIQVRHGKAATEFIDGFIQDQMRGHTRMGAIYDRLFNWFNRNYATSVLALKPQIGIKQFTSLFAMMENVPVVDFIGSMASFAKSPAKSARFLWERSPALQARGTSIDVEIARISSADPEMLNFSKFQRWKDLTLIFVKLGDRAPIYLGGWAAFQNAIKQGKTEAEAINEFEKIMNATQQSSDLDQLSPLQRSSGVARSLVMFMSAPVALMRGEIRAIRQFSRGKISMAEFAKRMAIYHFIIPAFFQFIASGFRFDDEDQLRSMVMGSFNGLIIYADIISNIINETIAEGFISDRQNIPAFDVPRQVMKGVVDAIQAWDEGDTEEMLDSLREMAEAAGKGSGLPVEQVFSFLEGTKALAEGEIEEGTKLTLGWPKSVIKEIRNR